jgi:hypothetical protein
MVHIEIIQCIFAAELMRECLGGEKRQNEMVQQAPGQIPACHPE